MKNNLGGFYKKFKFHDLGILSREEQKRFKNYHLPIFDCPSCGSFKNEGTGEINILGQSCVNCGDTESLKEFEKSSFKQFKKGKFAFKLDLSQRDHQEVIRHFQTYVLWQCDHCGRQNFNLPKDSNGNPDVQSGTSCQGCPSPYDLNQDFLSFWAMKGFGFDDGDDSSNTYELKKLAEGQFLWLQAIAKARKIDTQKGESVTEELFALESGLKKVKSRSRSIAGGRLKDGQRLIEFLEDYLDDEHSITFQKRARRVSKRVRNYTHEVIATNSTYKKTPHHVDSGLLERYFYNLSRLDFATTGWTSFGAFMSFIALSAMIEGNWERDIAGVSHSARIERQDKGILNLQYSFSRREPSYNQDYDGDDLEEGIEYETILDDTGVSRFNSYNNQREYYRLSLRGGVEEINNGYTDLDTGRNKLVWVTKACPSTGDTSLPSGGSTYTPSGGSSGQGYDGNGGLFHHPEYNDFLPDGYIDVTSLNPSIGEKVISISGEIAAGLLGISPAYADTCGDWESRDIEVEAERFVTVQRYSVWDWDESNWYSSEIIPGTNYQDTFRELEGRILEDTSNQRLVDNRLIMQIEARDENGEEFVIPITDRNQWINISQNIGESCTIQKSYLMRWLKGINSDDMVRQCIQ